MAFLALPLPCSHPEALPALSMAQGTALCRLRAKVPNRLLFREKAQCNFIPLFSLRKGLRGGGP